jgi:hypothetical protein
LCRRSGCLRNIRMLLVFGTGQPAGMFSLAARLVFSPA